MATGVAKVWAWQRLMKTHSVRFAPAYSTLSTQLDQIYIHIYILGTSTHTPKTFAINAANILHQIGTLLVNKRAKAHDLQQLPESAYNLYMILCKRENEFDYRQNLVSLSKGILYYLILCRK